MVISFIYFLQNLEEDSERKLHYIAYINMTSYNLSELQKYPHNLNPMRLVCGNMTNQIYDIYYDLSI